MVLCGVPLSKQLEINDWTHDNGVHFISADTRGLFGYAAAAVAICVLGIHRLYSTAFNDFGPKFTCVDPTGEQPLSGMIVSVDRVSKSTALYSLRSDTWSPYRTARVS